MIGIIDYGMGNLHSVSNACKHLGLDCLISSTPAVLAKCDKLILPGVGAFEDMAKALKEHDLWTFLKEEVGMNRKPLLGICLGMQALFERSYEFGSFEGLNLLQGEVKAMQPYGIRIPEIGWNELVVAKDSPLYELLGEHPFVYYDHTYYAVSWNPSQLVAYSEYGPYVVPGIVCRDNILGTQFHPEKSGKTGLKILEWFGKEFGI